MKTVTTYIDKIINCIKHFFIDLGDFVSTVDVKGKKFLHVEPEGLTLLSEHAYTDISHLLRPGHLKVLKYMNS